MNICVCGWYFDDLWYATLERLHRKHPVTIVANRHHALLDATHLPYAIRQNTGLEFGAYDYYLKNMWDGGRILFCHDDLMLLPTIKCFELTDGSHIFDSIDEYDCDQAYVFHDRTEDLVNWGMHGRMILISDRMAKALRDGGGIWHDEKNDGYTNGPPPNGMAHFNVACSEFNKRVSGMKDMNCGHKLYVPAIVMGVRGEFRGTVIT